ncbi:MAG: adenylate/guanylate cyclase domain-containing protein [Bacteroidota bacterium]
MKRPNQKLVIKLRLLAVIAFSWAFIGFLLAFFDSLTIAASFVHTHNELYSFRNDAITNMIGGFLGGLVAGGGTVFYLKDRFRSFRFWVMILYHLLYYVATIVIVVAFICLLVIPIIIGEPFGSQTALDFAKAFVFSTMMVRLLLVWSIIGMLTSFLLIINDRYGPGVLWSVMTGYYHQPKQEVRIFMFLDIKGSTQIAERLGHVRYFDFLNDFFRDLSDPILYRRGEIYQYVGDEVVVSWKLRNGIHQLNCVHCFYEIKEKIQARRDYYESTYGIFPEFKAGLHYGPVTTGEIGGIKREIVFTGDALNTAARIQGLCNAYQVELLMSRDLFNLLPPGGSYYPKSMGAIALRGKNERVNLITLVDQQDDLVPDTLRVPDPVFQN